MRIIAKSTLAAFWEKYPDSKSSLDHWYQVVKKNNFQHLADLKKTFPSADYVEGFVVFNIGGNKYRLVVDMVYSIGHVYIKHIMTHADYDKGKWKNDDSSR